MMDILLGCMDGNLSEIVFYIHTTFYIHTIKVVLDRKHAARSIHMLISSYFSNCSALIIKVNMNINIS